MSLNFLPTSVFVLFCVVLSVVSIIVCIKRKRLGIKTSIVVVFLTLSILPLIAAAGRIFEKLNGNGKYNIYFLYAIIIILAIFFIELVYLAITQKGNAQSKKLFIISFGLIAFSIILSVIAYLILGP